MLLAQDFLKESASGECRGGFNSRLYGDSNLETLRGIPHGSRLASRNKGWEIADKMIREGKIYSIEDGVEFKCSQDGDTWREAVDLFIAKSKTDITN